VVAELGEVFGAVEFDRLALAAVVDYFVADSGDPYWRWLILPCSGTGLAAALAEVSLRLPDFAHGAVAAPDLDLVGVADSDPEPDFG
jgi:hypothetical protein